MDTGSSMKYKVGLILLTLGFIMPLFAFTVPFLGFSTSATAFIAGVFIVGGPELCFFIGIVLAGKEAVKLVKQRLLKPAGIVRYRLGLVLFIISILINWVAAYLEVTKVFFINLHSQLYIMASFDLLLLLSVFLMGPEFFIKFKNIFIWEGLKKTEN
jgi:hypothetical protein